jgi:hypothetical protein
MSVGRFRKVMLLSAGALALPSCGGGGGGVASMPAAPLTPTPTPSPTTTLSLVQIFDHPVDGQMASVGLEAPGNDSASLTTTGFSVSYDAFVDRYNIKVPSMTTGYFYRTGNDVDANWWIGTLATLERTDAHGEVGVRKPSGLQTTYTTLANYNLAGGANVPFGWVAFGSATPAANVPTTGAATFNATLGGSSVQRYGQVIGTAALQFDFAAGQLSGHLDPILTDPTGLGFQDQPLGRYDFVNTVYAVGSASFSGQLSNAGVTGLGSFNGLFTGPSAQELMGRWNAPYQFPGTTETNQMFGVLVGKRP